MTKRDFELIAATLKQALRDAEAHQNGAPIRQLAWDFADRLKSTNKQFNADKFLRACGVLS